MRTVQLATGVRIEASEGQAAGRDCLLCGEPPPEARSPVGSRDETGRQVFIWPGHPRVKFTQTGIGSWI